MNRTYRVFEGLSDADMNELEALAQEYRYSNEDIEYAEPGDPVFDYRREIFEDVASILYQEGEFEFRYREGRMWPFECYGIVTYKSGVVNRMCGQSGVSFFGALRSCLASGAQAVVED